MLARYTDSKTTCLRQLESPLIDADGDGEGLGAEVELELVLQLGTLLPGRR